MFLEIDSLPLTVHPTLQSLLKLGVGTFVAIRLTFTLRHFVGTVNLSFALDMICFEILNSLEM